MRVDARVGSAKGGYAEGYALTGPPSGGKSFVVLRLLRLLGQGSKHHCTPLPGIYFVTPPRQDANASMPVTAELAGCRLTTPKEQPTKPLDPGALKAILDDSDVNVSARHNNSQAGADINFSVTWTILIQSQGSMKLKEGETDIGTLDKIIEMRPPFLFLPEAELEPTNPRHRLADFELADLCNAGGLNGELLFHMQCWYPLLDRDVCTFRTIMPPPPKSLGYRQEANEEAGTGGDKLLKWMEKRLRYCTEKEAAPTRDIHKAIKDELGKVEPSMRTQAGIGPAVGQYRAGPKSEHHDFYRVLIPGQGNKARPVRLRVCSEL